MDQLAPFGLLMIILVTATLVCWALHHEAEQQRKRAQRSWDLYIDATDRLTALQARCDMLTRSQDVMPPSSQEDATAVKKHRTMRG